MKSARLEPNHCVSRTNLPSIKHPPFLHDANNRPADVILPRTIEPRHLGGFAADQCAAILGAASRKPFDDLGKDVRLEFSSSEIIEEEEGFGAEHGDVVDTMVDQILANGLVPIHRKRNLQL